MRPAPARLALVLAFGLGFGGLPLAAGTLTVTATGEAAAAPDMATVSVGVTTEAAGAAEAMAANAATMTAVLARLAEQGIADRDLQTAQLSLQPRWEGRPSRDDAPPQVVGYIASNQLMVRVRDLSALGRVLEAALDDGANSLGGLSFSVADAAALKAEARRRAVAGAREAAEVLAEAAGVSLGAVEEIVEGGGGRPAPFGVARMEMAASDAIPVAPGEIDVAATVTITWTVE